MVSAMKTRKPDTPKSTTTKKPAPATTPTEPVTENQAPAAPKPTVTKPAPAIKAKQVKTKATTAPSLGSPQPAVEEAKASPDVVKVTPEKKAVPRTRIVKKIVKKIVVRKKVPTSTKAVANKSPPMLVTKFANVEESSKKEEIEDAKDVEFVNKEESTLVSAKESVKKEETNVQNAERFTMEGHDVENVEEPTTKEEVTGDAQPLVENVEEPTKKNEVPVDAQPSVENVEEQTKKKEVAGDVKRLDENVEELTKKNEVAVDAQPSVENVEEPTKKKKVAGDVQPLVENVEELTKKEEVACDVRLSVESVEELTKKEEVAGDAQTLAETVLLCSKKEVPALTDSVKSSANQETSIEKAEEEETNMIEDKVELNQPVNMDKNTNEESKGDDVPPWEQVDINDEKMERRDDKESHEEYGEEDLVEDNVVEHGEESAELKEENAELTALAKERKIKKELEIFVGGLDRDAVEDDVKKVFDNVGEVVEVRLQKNPSSNKNKGYAFVRFATKEQATRALAEIKNPVIHGKRCRTSPSEDNDTLFLGNICNTWTKEAIKQKLKDYGIDGVENINLVEDPQHEGLSRGFALVEFSCHAEAMFAYKRLQKPDVRFGHSDRTAKVAFAEPLPEPDPAVMALVKSVFVDGLPPHWDEDRVRKEFKCYGDLDRITLARNMSNAKRKDFGFVDFTTHEAAVACIDDINTRGLGDGKFKTRVRARLSNPLPKTQIVKGGMCGGFRIGHPSGGTFSKFGKGFRRGGHPDFGVQDFQHNWGFYQHGSAQTYRMSFIDERDFDSPYPPTHGMESFQGRRWGPTVPARHVLDRFKHGDTDRGPGRHMPWRGQPVFPEEEFNRPFLGRQFDGPYRYDGSAHGIKRRNFTGKHSDYEEPSRVRARYDYSDPAFSLRGTRYRDTFGDGSSLYSHSHDYYGPEYPRDSDSSFYGGDHPYGGRYYQ